MEQVKEEKKDKNDINGKEQSKIKKKKIKNKNKSTKKPIKGLKDLLESVEEDKIQKKLKKKKKEKLKNDKTNEKKEENEKKSKKHLENYILKNVETNNEIIKEEKNDMFSGVHEYYKGCETNIIKTNQYSVTIDLSKSINFVDKAIFTTNNNFNFYNNKFIINEKNRNKNIFYVNNYTEENYINQNNQYNLSIIKNNIVNLNLNNSSNNPHYCQDNYNYNCIINQNNEDYNLKYCSNNLNVNLFCNNLYLSNANEDSTFNKFNTDVYTLKKNYSNMIHSNKNNEEEEDEIEDEENESESQSEVGVKKKNHFLKKVYNSDKKCTHINKELNYNSGKINVLNKKDSNSSNGKKKNPFCRRPDDWICLRCYNLNFSFRIFCNRCSAPKEVSTVNNI